MYRSSLRAFPLIQFPHNYRRSMAGSNSQIAPNPFHQALRAFCLCYSANFFKTVIKVVLSSYYKLNVQD